MGTELAASADRLTTESEEPILRYFAWGHLPLALQDVSRPFGELALYLYDTIPRSPERTVALRKLLEGKDAAVRAALPPAPAYPLVPKGSALAPAVQLAIQSAVREINETYAAILPPGTTIAFEARPIAGFTQPREE